MRFPGSPDTNVKRLTGEEWKGRVVEGAELRSRGSRTVWPAPTQVPEGAVRSSVRPSIAWSTRRRGRPGRHARGRGRGPLAAAAARRDEPLDGRELAELAASKTLASIVPDGWARGEREGYGEPAT